MQKETKVMVLGVACGQNDIKRKINQFENKIDENLSNLFNEF